MSQIITVLLVGLVAVSGIAGYNHHVYEISKRDREIEYLTQHRDFKSGGTSLLTGEPINYNLRTFDGGRTWYAVEFDNESRMTILGEAEEVFPGLLDHISALDRLTEYAKLHGPITGNSQEGIEILEAAGFEVKEDE